MEKDKLATIKLNEENLARLEELFEVMQLSKKYLTIESDNKEILRSACVDSGLLGFLYEQLEKSDDSVKGRLSENLDEIKEVATNMETKEKEWNLLKTLSIKKYKEIKNRKLVRFEGSHCESECPCGHKH